MSATEYPITMEVQPVVMPVDVAKPGIVRKAKHAWSWVEYVWDVTAPPRIGFSKIRDEREDYLAAHGEGERVCSDLYATAEAIDPKHTKKREKAFEQYNKKRRSLDRRYGMRKKIVIAQQWWPLPVEAYCALTMPRWEAGLVSMGMATTIGAWWTYKGMRSGECPEPQRPATLPKPSVVSGDLIQGAWSQLPLAKYGPLQLLDEVQQTAADNGWIVPVLLPGTLLVEEFEKFHGQFAKVLGNRQRELVHIVRDATQGDGFFWLQVYRKTAGERSIGSSPLAQLTETNAADGVTLAVDSLDQERSIIPGSSHIFIGGRSQMGKSKTVEQIVAWLMLDRDADLHVLDLSGKENNYKRFSDLAGFFLCGLTSEDRDEAMAYLDWLDVERGNRNEDSKPLFIVLDEIHELVRSHKRAEDVLDRLGRNTLGMNIHFIVVTQKPDRASIPSGLLGQCGIRIGLPVKESWVSDLVIPNGQQRKIDCSKLPQVAGYCVIDDEQGATQARIYPPEPSVIEAKVQLALAMRGGEVPKLDLSPPPEPEPIPMPAAPAKRSTKFPHLLQDIAEMMREKNEWRLWCREIAPNLPERPEYIAAFPHVEQKDGYVGPDYSALASELRRILGSDGVKKSIKKNGEVFAGVTEETINAALNQGVNS